MRGWSPGLALPALVCVGSAVRAKAPEWEAVKQLAADSRLSEALEALESLLARDPDDPEGLLLKGVLLAELGRTGEAKTIFLELTQRQPHLPEPYNNLAAMYAAAGEYEQAIELLKLALRTHPSYATAFENLTKVYGKLASEAYDRALGRERGPRVEPVELGLLAELESRAPRESPLPSGERPAPGSIRANPGFSRFSC